MFNIANTEVPVKGATATVPKKTTIERERMIAWLDAHIKASKSKPVAEVVTLTPVLASLLLERNPVNRPIGRYNMEQLQADVAAGRFEFNGESIVVSNSGVLIDGQHRCNTVVMTGIPIETVIVFGPKESARYTIDIGKPKTSANYLSMKGWSDANNFAATLSLIILYRQHQTVSHSQQRPTKTEIISAADQFRGVQESVDFVTSATKRKLGSRSALAFCHYTFWKKASREAADQFIGALIENDGLRKGSPIHYCRERLQGMDRGVRVESRVEMIFKCWNAWRTGESITKIPLTGNLPKLER
jgi:hypothetical protein